LVDYQDQRIFCVLRKIDKNNHIEIIVGEWVYNRVLKMGF